MNRFSTLSLALALSWAGAAHAESKTVLVVGASHTVGWFGKDLEALLAAWPETRVALYAVCSSSPESWLNEDWKAPCSRFSDEVPAKSAPWRAPSRQATKVVDGKTIRMVKTPSLAKLLESQNPELVLITLGTNGLTESGVRAVLQLIHPPNGAPGRLCAWVGPPYTRRPDKASVDRYYAALSANGVSEGASAETARKDACFLIDSRRLPQLDYALYPEKGDGTHYDGPLRPLAADWAAHVESRLATFLGR